MQSRFSALPSRVLNAFCTQVFSRSTVHRDSSAQHMGKREKIAKEESSSQVSNREDGMTFARRSFRSSEEERNKRSRPFLLRQKPERL